MICFGTLHRLTNVNTSLNSKVLIHRKRKLRLLSKKSFSLKLLQVLFQLLFFYPMLSAWCSTQFNLFNMKSFHTVRFKVTSSSSSLLDLDLDCGNYFFHFSSVDAMTQQWEILKTVSMQDQELKYGSSSTLTLSWLEWKLFQLFQFLPWTLFLSRDSTIWESEDYKQKCKNMSQNQVQYKLESS